jgi:hypothetical protein
MNDYMVNLNDASISLFGEGFVEPREAQEGSPPHPQYDVGMSATATWSSCFSLSRTHRRTLYHYIKKKGAKRPDLYKNTTHTHIHVTPALIGKLEKNQHVLTLYTTGSCAIRDVIPFAPAISHTLLSSYAWVMAAIIPLPHEVVVQLYVASHP